MDVDSLVSEELRLQMYTKEVRRPVVYRLHVWVCPSPAETFLRQSFRPLLASALFVDAGLNGSFISCLAGHASWDGHAPSIQAKDMCCYAAYKWVLWVLSFQIAEVFRPSVVPVFVVRSTSGTEE